MAFERRLPRLCAFLVCAAGALACSQQPSTTPDTVSRPSIAERQAFTTTALASLQQLRAQIDSLDRQRQAVPASARADRSADVARRRAILDTLEQQLLAVTTADDATYGALCQIFLTYRHKNTSLRSHHPRQDRLASMFP